MPVGMRRTVNGRDLERVERERGTSCSEWPHSGTMCGFSPGSLKLKLRGSRQTGHSASSSRMSLEGMIGMCWESRRGRGWEKVEVIWELEAFESAEERWERADAEAGEPKSISAGPLFFDFLSEEKTDLIEELIEGTFGTGRGEVYAEGGNDGRGRNRRSSVSSTGFLNIQLDPAIVMEVERDVGHQCRSPSVALGAVMRPSIPSQPVWSWSCATSCEDEFRDISESEGIRCSRKHIRRQQLESHHGHPDGVRNIYPLPPLVATISTNKNSLLGIRIAPHLSMYLAPAQSQLANMRARPEQPPRTGFRLEIGPGCPLHSLGP